MNNELAVLASELPVLQTKGAYKYLKEITGNGAYYQVAWQKLTRQYDYKSKEGHKISY